MPTSSKDIEVLIRKNDYLQGQRGDWLSYWQDVANFCLPRKAWITTIKVYGEQLKTNFIYDSRAILALKKSASGFHSNLTNPASKWFSFRTLNEKLMQSGNVQRYFKEVEDIQYGVINNSNFNETMLEYYTDDLCFGTSAILSEEDYKEHVRYTSVPLEQINIELDDRGEVCAVYRCFKFTANQCEQRWPNNLSKGIKDALKDDKGFQKFEILNYIGPRNNRDVSKQDNVNMPYRSVWIVKKESHELATSGFVENPYHVTRFWVHADDLYGYSPAMDVLASVKLANAQKRTLIRKAMKDTDPATMAPFRFWTAPLNQNPGAMNYYDSTKFKLDQYGPMHTGGNPQLGADMMELEQRIIDEGFFIPLFESLANVTKQMTVPEVQKRISDSLSLIGPVVGRMTKGIASSQLRTYSILERQMMFPEPPKEIQGQDLNLTFLSPLAKAQRSSELNGLVTLLNVVQQMSAFIPDAKDKIDGDRIIDGAADLLGVDPTYLREQEQVDSIRQKTAELRQQAMQLEMAGKAAGAAKDVAGARKDHAQATTMQ